MDSKDKNNVSGKKMRVRDYFYWALSILLIGLLFVCVILFAIGFRPAVVLTPSMKPTVNPGSLVLVKSIDANKIKVGDIVMFWPSADGETDADEISVTHRVIEIRTDAETGKLIFITHGDANPEGSNEKVPQSQIIGKVHLAIPVFGILFLFIKNNLFVIIFGIIAIVCLWYLIAMIIKNNKAKKATVDSNENVVETTGEVVEQNAQNDNIPAQNDSKPTQNDSKPTQNDSKVSRNNDNASQHDNNGLKNDNNNSQRNNNTSKNK